jgi:hypothetical protein
MKGQVQGMAYADQYDSLVLQVMCEEPGPWSREELEREFSDRTAAADALNRLRSRGLVLDMDGGFVLTSAAGRYSHALDQSAA